MKKIVFLSLFFPVFCFGQWVQVGNSINGQAANARFGWSTAISGNGMVVATGAIFNSSAFSNAGQVTVYGLANGTWGQIGTPINGESSGDQTGQSVSLSEDGSILAIGEPFNNDLGFTSGQVRVFRNINNNWSPVGQDLMGQNATAGAGTSIDLSADGSVVAFGAPNTTVSGVLGGTGFTGIVEVHELQGNTWVQKGGDINGDGTIIKFGQSVSLSSDGNTIAIGQTGNPAQNPATDIGRVKVYQFIGNQWVQVGNTIFGTATSDEFGYKVSLSASGNILAIGTNTKNEVKVFELIGGVWTQIGSTLTGEGGSDLFGFSLGLSNDGSVLAVGARWNSTDGFRRGRAYVFKNQGGNWQLVDNAISGIANSDQNGFSVSLSKDGSRVVISALENDDAGANTGQLRVFENVALVPIKLLYFGGSFSNNEVTLNWKYESQTNFSHFVVEKSLNGIDFNGIKNVGLTNAQVYYYKDLDINNASKFYYRLKLVDKDGKFSYSNIIKIQTGAVNTFSVMGNPVKDNLSITGLKRGSTLAIYDNAGKLLLQKNVQDQSVLMDISFLSSGVYYLRCLNDELIETKKIIKQ
jgi:hypothetical protein